MHVAARVFACVFEQKVFMWRGDAFNTITKNTLYGLFYQFPYDPLSTVCVCMHIRPRVTAPKQAQDRVPVQNVSLTCIVLQIMNVIAGYFG